MLLSDAATYGQMKNQVAADLTSALFLRRSAADLPGNGKGRANLPGPSRADAMLAATRKAGYSQPPLALLKTQPALQCTTSAPSRIDLPRSTRTAASPCWNYPTAVTSPAAFVSDLDCWFGDDEPDDTPQVTLNSADGSKPPSAALPE